MFQLLDRVRLEIKEGGVVWTGTLALEKTLKTLGWKNTWAVRQRFLDREGISYDRKHKVKTYGVTGKASTERRGYEAISVLHFNKVMRRLPIRHESYTFIDVGCGKGRPLFLASEFPFKQIIGVEYSPSLCDVARSNIESFHSDRQRCFHIDVVESDACEYVVPDGPLVVFLFNPFGEDLMRKFVTGLAHSLSRAPRHMIIIYCLGVHANVFRECVSFRELIEPPFGSDPWVSFFESCP